MGNNQPYEGDCYSRSRFVTDVARLNDTGRESRPPIAPSQWVSLFNGKDLTGWETYDIENGFNNDRRRIYTVARRRRRARDSHLGRNPRRPRYPRGVRRLSASAPVQVGPEEVAAARDQPFDSGLLYHSASLKDSPMRLGPTTRGRIGHGCNRSNLVSSKAATAAKAARPAICIACSSRSPTSRASRYLKNNGDTRRF